MSVTSASVHPSIEEIDPAEWNGLVGPENLPASHRFVGLCERSGVEDAVYRHVVVRQGTRPVLAASLCCFRVHLDLMAEPRAQQTLQRVRGRFPGFLAPRVLIGGLPASFAQSCLGMDANGQTAASLGLLAEVAEDVARDLGAGFVAFKEFTPGEAEALLPLEQHGYFRAASLPTCTLDVGGASFEDYLGRLRHPYRRQLRATESRAAERGLVVRTVDEVTAHAQTLFGLYSQVMDRTDFAFERLNLRFFDELASTMERAVRAVLVEQDGHVVAGGLLLQGSQTLNSLLTGLDYGHPAAHDAYHALMLAIVREAHRTGVSTLELGQTSWPSKTRLGAEVVPRWLYVRHRSRRRNRMFRAARPLLFSSVDTGPVRRVFRE